VSQIQGQITQKAQLLNNSKKSSKNLYFAEKKKKETEEKIQNHPQYV